MTKRLTVFCGSRHGVRPRYAELAREFGKLLARRSIGLVYGGASNGLMGVLADAVMTHGGSVIGVFPKMGVAREVAHGGLTELLEVNDMHARKAMMGALGDAYVALPGGFGTCDELFEALTWRLLGLHNKPIGVLELPNEPSPIRTLIETTIADGFADEVDPAALRFDHDPERLLHALIAKPR
jgi:uncharacterized protein (TIGR00730 family)